MTVTAAVTSPTQTGARPWWALAVLALPTLLVALDANVLLLALPKLTADLGASNVQQLWITDAYGFMVAGLVITMGTLGDRIGRRRLLMIGMAVFALASLACAWATDPIMLIVARAVQGMAGATLMPSTLALISNIFRDDRQRGKAISIWATCTFTGAALGPVLGGLLLVPFWWGAVFLLAIPVAAVVLIAGPVLLPEFRPEKARRLDITSVVLSLLGILPVVFAVKVLSLGNGSALSAGVALIVGLVFGTLFVRRQLRVDDPLLDLRLFANSSFTLILSALALAGMVLAGTALTVTQLLQTVLGYSPLASAVWFMPMGLFMAVGTMSTPALTRVITPRTAIIGGMFLSAIGAAVLILVDDGHGAWASVLGAAVVGLGAGPLFALGTGLVVDSVPPERAGSAASMAETANYLGGALGLAVLGTVSSAVYSHRVSDALPTGLGGAATERAQETVAGAAAEASHLGSDASAALLQAAHSAFLNGLNVVAVISTAVFVLLAVLAGVHFQRAGRPAATEPVSSD
ncbi:MFS transporter [Streptomyces ficellus]|uniref:MFS transporter n=1 Tax=Streptomyces ficellus TaxID=1977088 RepID=A0ABT7YZX8_9ACTN|nr:MFS transporter [Streptomyces ficellus]MDN3292788.1 MFS transporter [Streptomyces ficellus]